MRTFRFFKIFSGFIFSLFFLFAGAELFADGFIVPKPKPGEVIPPPSVKSHRVTVAIANQVAKTSVDQVFLNNHSRDIEGTFIFPLPENASISEFAMFVGDKKIEGEILDSIQARQTYEDIVRRLKDPALLEYIGRNMFRARVFPIPAQGEKRIQLSYTEILKAEKGLVRYIYPLSTEKFSFHPLQEVSLSARIESKIPITNIYSPSHKVSVRKEGENKATVGYEGTNIKPDKDFVVYYSLSQDDVGLSFMNWEGQEENYYMLLAAPHYTAEKEKVLNKNLIFALDSSGSMSGNKIRQAKDAVRFIINHLDDDDRFSVIDFDDGVTLFNPELIPATSQNKQKALKFVEGIEDSGGTNIHDALTKALGMTQPGERPNYILFLTDGLPTVGITETGEILKDVARANELNSRVFVFGVGYDVNTELLDKISSENRGASVYVGESEDLEVSISNYYEKISSPLLSDLSLAFKGIEVSNSYPMTLPDLFKGSQLVVLGKYKGEGPVTIILKGKVGKKERSFALENQKLTKDNSANFLARLWATRRIGYLLEEIRLHGSSNELIEEVKKLGLKFGIVTPYTSFLVTEKERLVLEAAAPEALDAIKSGKVTGVGAVKAAITTQRFKQEEQAPHVESEQIRYMEDKTFYFKKGYWVDSLYKEGDPFKEVRFGSEEYFRLISEKPAIAKYFSVAARLILSFRGVNYKIIE